MLKHWTHRVMELLYRIAGLLELVVGVILVGAICIAMLQLFQEVGLLWRTAGEEDAFHNFLATAFTIVIGVEFLKMLCRHTMQSVVEVILFATARQMVVEHTNHIETLIMVLALAILFVIRKYLFIPAVDSMEAHHAHDAQHAPTSEKVGTQAN